MAREFRHRRGTRADHENFVGAPGEITVDTDYWIPVVHDGRTPGGHRINGQPTTPPLPTGAVIGIGITRIMSLTQGQYNALPFVDPTTLYVIVADLYVVEPGFMFMQGMEMNILEE